MAKRFPDALAMTELKYGDAPDAEKDEMAQALVEAGRRSEAILLFQGRADHPFVKAQAEWAAQEGASFHLLLIKGMGGNVSDDLVRLCGQAAEQKGRFLDARRCYEELGDEEAIRTFADQLPERLRPAAAPVTEPE